MTYVIPPKVGVANGISDTALNELCYQYTYDHRNRLIEKKIPGKGWESIVYNKLDQPVLTQDALLKQDNQWLFTKYDAMGRVAYTGKIVITNKTRSQLQTETDDVTEALWVQTGPEAMIGGTTMYYTNGGYPNVQNAEVLTINYYHDYQFLGNTPVASFVNPVQVYEQPISNRTKSLATGSKVKVLGTLDWITTITYYDEKARPVYIVSENEYLNTVDIVESKLDFAGNVLETKTTHTKGINAPIVTIDSFTYDHMGRLLDQTQTINTQAPERIVANTYDELGQLQSKEVGGTSASLSGSATEGGLQKVDYTYNVRGWLQTINEGTAENGDLFGFTINYNTTTKNLGATALYNGNISETSWKTANDNTKRAYGYQYDALNRILAGTSTDGRYNLSNVTYDKNGNIETLQRTGAIIANPDQTRSGDFGMMDKLVYEYDQGNKLRTVTDQVIAPFGFSKNTTVTGNQYQYDVNGNMTIDHNKGISSIAYNHLNLPTSIAIANSEGTGNISYIYDATGAKLKKIVTEGSSLIATEYAGNYIYENGQLQFFNTPEGYVEPNGTDGFDYVYQLKDIWGNTRITFSDGDDDGKIDLVRNDADVDGDGDLTHEIRREQNFYPFGLEHKGYNTTLRGVKNNLKTYQGQEFTEDLGLNTHEWRYRVSDPAIGRFWQIDPLAEDYVYNSTYAFQENKMGMGVELEGLEMVSERSKDGKSVTITYNVKPINNSALTTDQFNTLVDKRVTQTQSSLSGETKEGIDVTVNVVVSNDATITWEYNSSLEDVPSEGQVLGEGHTKEIGNTQENRTQVPVYSIFGEDGELNFSEENIQNATVTGTHEDGHVGGLNHYGYTKEKSVRNAMKKDKKNLMKETPSNTDTNVLKEQRSILLKQVESQQK